MGKRLSKLMELEILEVSEGSKFGYIGDCDLIFERESGEIKTLVAGKGGFSLFKNNDFIEIPWNKRLNMYEKTILFDLRTKIL